VIHWQLYLNSLLSIGLLAFFGWLISLARNQVTHVDSMWSLFIMLSAYNYALLLKDLTPRMFLVLFLVSLWAIRLCVYLTWRNWGSYEDHRYAAIRQNNEPNFWIKSIYIIFGLQAVLAWIISMPLVGAIESKVLLTRLDFLGCIVFMIGFVLETIADCQLSIFKANPSNKGKVLNYGLWRFSRHPNYFGECFVWWGFYLIAAAGGALWTIAGPVLMTLLLLKVSGVVLLEKDIAERRPDYLNYIKNTNAFIPWFPKRSS
jgi:steroid 5-alpha reductase family enzyme